MSSISHRIRHLYDVELKLTQLEFAKEVEVGASTISNIVVNDSSPNFLLIKKILEKWPKLNAEWLCIGIGPIWKTDDNVVYVPVYREQPVDKDELLNLEILFSRFKKMEAKCDELEDKVKDLENQFLSFPR